MRRHSLLAVLLTACLSAPIHLSNALAEETACPPNWQTNADKQARAGLLAFQSPDVANRVAYWRRVALDESMPTPTGRDYGFYGAWRWGSSGAYVELAKKLGAAADSQGRSGPAQIYLYSNDLLKERVRLLGEQHPYVREWVANQNVVYGNDVGMDVKLPTIKGIYDGPAAALAQDDIAYQQAAAFYYGAAFDQAEARFKAIAGSTSRHRDVAAYMIAKTFVAAKRYADAIREIDAIRANPARAAVHLMAGELYGYIRSVMRATFIEGGDPTYEIAKERALVFDAELLSASTVQIESDPQMKAAFWQATFNLSFYLYSDAGRRAAPGDEIEDWWLDDASALSHGFAAAARQQEILDWLQATASVSALVNAPGMVYWSARLDGRGFQRMNAHIAERIQNGHAVAWEVLRLARAEQISSSAILGEAQQAAGDCTATEQQQWVNGVVQYHSRRLRIMASRERVSDKWWVTADNKPIPAADRLYFFGMDYAGNPKKTALAAINLLELADVVPPYEFPDDIMSLANLMPLSHIPAFVALKNVPDSYKAAITRMAWTRAYLLDRADALGEITPLLLTFNPELAPFVGEIDSARTEAGRRHAALTMLLSVPAMNMRIALGEDAGTQRLPSSREQVSVLKTDGHNPNDANWWCRFDPMQEMAAFKRYFFDVPVGLAPAPRSYFRELGSAGSTSAAFPNNARAYIEDNRNRLLKTHPLTQSIDWQELGALSKIEAAPTYLGRQAIAWAKDAGWFDRWWEGDEIAEALALTVRATRWGCTRDGSDAEISRQAYVLLHQLFPDSEAAARTRYWYN